MRPNPRLGTGADGAASDEFGVSRSEYAKLVCCVVKETLPNLRWVVADALGYLLEMTRVHVPRQVMGREEEVQDTLFEENDKLLLAVHWLPTLYLGKPGGEIFCLRT
jgi:hypothetical protein